VTVYEDEVSMAFDDSDDEPAIVTGALRWLQLNVRIVHQAHFRSGRWTSLIVDHIPRHRDKRRVSR
jgi:hypothetical protein